MPEISLIGAFLAGFASFLSPCVLPLVPGYISYMTGVSADELLSKGANTHRVISHVLLRCILFVLGFSIVFILMGASATTLGRFILQRLNLFSKISGVVLIIFGIHLTHVLQFTPLNYEKRFHLEHRPVGHIGSFIIGVVFAFGWTPCIGPILGGILLYAGMQQTVGYGMVLLGAYSLGLGLPFIITGLSVNSFMVFFHRIKKYLGIIEIISGIILIIGGILFLTGNFQQLSGFIAGLMEGQF